MPQEDLERLERSLLLHLLEHRGQQIRFEADQWTTEFGIARKFASEDPANLKDAIRALEMTRMVLRRTQYVVGYSEPKHVFCLTPSGHRKALEHQKEDNIKGARHPDEASTPLYRSPQPDPAPGS
jgi:hypothetical protein